ncbi:MAG: hypothetical protein LZF62_410056 [Nitrospira sp.]|nr:MAG: hypothetical protein LZF62_410056 [Nitrospira sp.]
MVHGPREVWNKENTKEVTEAVLGISADRALQFPDRTLQDGHLGHGVTGCLEFRADLFFEVVGVADFVDEQVEKTFGGQEALGLQFVEGLVAHRDVAGTDVENDVVVAIAPEPFEP